MKDRKDAITGRIIREDSNYLTEGVWVVWECSADEGGRSTIRRKGEDPEYMTSRTGKRFKCCMVEEPHEPRNMGEYEGRFLDALRYMHEVLGFEPYNPSDTEFEG